MGIVARNKKLDQNKIYVVPIEVTPFIDGKLDASVESKEAEGMDKYDQEYIVSVNESNSIEADWLKITNRRTPPDVRRGERVMIYRFGDTDRFYWGSLGMDDHLRKLETIVWSFSATEEEFPGADSTDPENAYSIEVSTHKKLLAIRTTKANGEPFAYDIQLNVKDGVFLIVDDVGNHIQLDSTETIITLKNKDGTEVHLDKKDIKFFAPNDITGECTNNFNLKAGNNCTFNIGNAFKVNADTVNTDSKTTTEINAGTSFNLKAGTTGKVEASTSLTLKAGNTIQTMNASGYTVNTDGTYNISAVAYSFS